MYKPGDIFYKEFVFCNVSGVPTNADSTPGGLFFYNGADDYTVKVYTSNLDQGRYVCSGVIPNTYLKGFSVGLNVTGYIAGLYQKGAFDLGQIDSKRIGDLQDVGATGVVYVGYVQQGVSVTGTAQANVISFSGVMVAAANSSGAILTDLRFINNILTSPYNGVAQSGGINWIQLQSSEPSIDNYYKNVIINIVGNQGMGQWGLISSYSGSTRTAYVDYNWFSVPYSGSLYSLAGYGASNIEYMNSQLLGSKAGINFNTFFQNAGNTTSEVVDNVGTGGINSTVSVTGVAPANFLGIGSIAPGVTVSVTGVVNANVITISGSMVAAPDSSGAILADIRYINGNPTATYNGIAQSGGVNWIQLATTEPAIDSYYQDQYIYLAGGVGLGQWGLITAYSGSAKTAYIDHNWYTIPYNNTKYLLGGYGIAQSVLSPVATTGSQAVVGVVSVTGVAPANFLGIGSIAPGVTVSVTGTPNVNVVSFSGSPVAAANSSGAVLTDLRFANGVSVANYNGIARSGGVNWIQLASTEPSTNNFYKDQYVAIVGGVGVNQIGLVTSYSGANQTAYVDHNWYVTPYNNSQYSFIGYGVVDSVLSAVATTGSQAVLGAVSVTGVAPTNFLGIGSISPGVTVSVTGTVQANVVSAVPGITVSVTGVVSNVLNVINPVGVTGVVQANVITVSGALVAAPDGSGFILTDIHAINNSYLGSKAGQNFNVFFQNAGNTTAEVVDNVGTGGSSSGITDWTPTERGQIRYLLGMDGSASIPVTAKPAITASVTGVAQSNVISISGSLVAAPDGFGYILTDLRSVGETSLSNKVGTNFNIFYQNAGNSTSEIVDNVGSGTSGGTDWTSTERSQIRYKLGIDGSATQPVTPYAGNLELSLSGLHNIMVENGVTMNQWMEAVGAVVAGSSTINGNQIIYYGMNNNGIQRVNSTAVSGAREVIVLLL